MITSNCKPIPSLPSLGMVLALMCGAYTSPVWAQSKRALEVRNECADKSVECHEKRKMQRKKTRAIRTKAAAKVAVASDSTAADSSATAVATADIPPTPTASKTPVMRKTRVVPPSPSTQKTPTATKTTTARKTPSKAKAPRSPAAAKTPVQAKLRSGAAAPSVSPPPRTVWIPMIEFELGAGNPKGASNALFGRAGFGTQGVLLEFRGRGYGYEEWLDSTSLGAISLRLGGAVIPTFHLFVYGGLNGLDYEGRWHAGVRTHVRAVEDSPWMLDFGMFWQREEDYWSRREWEAMLEFTISHLGLRGGIHSQRWRDQTLFGPQVSLVLRW